MLYVILTPRWDLEVSIFIKDFWHAACGVCRRDTIEKKTTLHYYYTNKNM